MSQPSYRTSSNSTVKFTVPHGWFTTVTAVFRKGDKQSMNVRSSVKGCEGLFHCDALRPGSSLLHQLEGTVTLPIPPRDRVTQVELSFYQEDFKPHAVKTHKGPVLIEREWLVHVSIVECAKPTRLVRGLPDYVTYQIFVEDTAVRDVARASDHERLNSAVAIVQMVKLADADMVSVDPSTDDQHPLPPVPEENVAPPPPPADVVRGYNQALDAPRPDVVEDYLQQYDTVFLVDDSGSMSVENRWHEACAALLSILDKAIENNARGIALRFFNSTESIDLKGGKLTKSAVRSVLSRVRPDGGTPIGERVVEQLERHMDRLDKAAGTRHYSKIKPLDVVVLTDGEPPGLPEGHPMELKTALVNAAARLRSNKRHPNAVAVRFVQIGLDPRLRAAMEALIHLDTNHMVDTIPYEGPGSLTPEKLDRILLGGTHPNMRV